MGFSGPRPPERVQRVWEIVRDARDAAVDRVPDGRAVAVHGFEIDRAARDVIEAAGFGDFFTTSHSIDRDLHGSGPHSTTTRPTTGS
jgi:Xaa-Pro aminopeptidase